MNKEIPLDYLTTDEKLIIFSDVLTAVLLEKLSELLGETEENLYKSCAIFCWNEIMNMNRVDIENHIKQCRSSLDKEVVCLKSN